jgi:hypothetical protein
MQSSPVFPISSVLCPTVLLSTLFSDTLNSNTTTLPHLLHPLRPGRFNPGANAPCTHWIGGWVDSRASLEAAAERKIPSSPLPVIEPRSSSPQPSHYTDWAIPTPASSLLGPYIPPTVRPRQILLQNHWFHWRPVEMRSAFVPRKCIARADIWYATRLTDVREVSAVRTTLRVWNNTWNSVP